LQQCNIACPHPALLSHDSTDNTALHGGCGQGQRTPETDLTVLPTLTSGWGKRVCGAHGGACSDGGPRREAKMAQNIQGGYCSPTLRRSRFLTLFVCGSHLSFPESHRVVSILQYISTSWMLALVVVELSNRSILASYMCM
jgi:hypothetical protein